MTLVTSFSPLGGGKEKYKKNDVVGGPWSSSGTQTIELLCSGYYKIEIVGGGGGSAVSRLGVNEYIYLNKHGGGSGAGYVGEVYLSRGSYTVTIGGVGASSETVAMVATSGGSGGTSTITNASNNDIIVSAGGGGGGSSNAGYVNGGSQGQGGTLTKNTNLYAFRNSTVNSNGNSATGTGTGGASVYEGYGKGNTAQAGNATAGYFQLTYIGRN